MQAIASPDYRHIPPETLAACLPSLRLRAEGRQGRVYGLAVAHCRQRRLRPACLHCAYAQKADKAECMGLRSVLSWSSLSSPPPPPYRSPPKGGALKIKKEARKNPNLLTQKRQVIIWPSFNYCRFRAVQFLHHKIHMR